MSNDEKKCDHVNYKCDVLKYVIFATCFSVRDWKDLESLNNNHH